MAQLIPIKKRNKDVTLADRKTIYYLVNSFKADGKENGHYQRVSEVIGIPARTISKVWRETSQRVQRYQQQQEEEDVILPDALFTTGRHLCGRKRTYDEDEIAAAIVDIPLKHRCTLRSTANALGVSHETIRSLLHDGVLRSHTATLKPSLTDKNKIERVFWR